MNVQTIAEHSIDLDLLSGGICIDVGCRGFQFSEAMRDKGCVVFACDIEPMVAPKGIQFAVHAVRSQRGNVYYTDTKDQQAKFISDSGLPVYAVPLSFLYDSFIDNVDILKLDCEGSEYDILSDPNFQPIPKQISVEFHMHAHRALHDQYYDVCMANLLKWYDPVKHELTQAHGAGWNYWDSLFIRKDLL